MEITRWISGAEVKEILGFKGVELVLISVGVSPHDPDSLTPIPWEHISKVKESWKYECSKGVAVCYDNDLLEDRLIGPHIKEGIQFWKNCRGRTPLVPLSGDDLRKAIQDFDGYLYDYAAVKKYSEEIIATYRNGVTPKDFVVMFKNKLAAHEGFSSKQLETLSMGLRKRFPETDFSDESIAQLIADVFQQCRCEQEQASIQFDEKQPKRSKKQVAQDIKADRQKSFDRLLEKTLAYAEEYISQGRRMRIDKDLYPFLCANSNGEEVSHNTKNEIWKKLPAAAKKGPGAPKKSE